MKTLSIFLTAILVAVSTANPTRPRVPQFSLRSWASRSNIPEVDVVFPNGAKDTLVLQRFYSSREVERSGKLNCNFIGHLANELEACVAMTGCPGEKDVELTVLSKNNEEHYRFEWKTDGTVIGQDSVLKDQDLEDTFEVDNDILEEDEQEPPQEPWDRFIATEAEDGCTAIETSADDKKCLTMPPGQRLEYKIFYTTTFRDVVEVENEMTPDEYIEEMLTHMQSYYCLDQYLGTAIRFDLIETELTEENLTSKDLSLARNIVWKDRSGADAIGFMTDDIWDVSGVGKAYTKTVCRTSMKNSRLHIAEHFKTRSGTGELVAHEMGHSLGFVHDNSKGHDDEYIAANGTLVNLGTHYEQKCWTEGVKGFMMGTGAGLRWTPCNAFDLLQRWRWYSVDAWCMEELTREEVCGAN